MDNKFHEFIIIILKTFIMKMIEIVLSRSPVCIEKMQLVFCRLLKSEYWRTF